MTTNPPSQQVQQQQGIKQAVSDEEFFNNLTHYRPIFYSGKGTPMFLANQGWKESFCCLACADVLAAAAIVLFIVNAEANQAKLEQQDLSLPLVIIVSVAVFALAHISLFLTQLLNPGIINPSSLLMSPMPNLSICKKCNNYRSQKMTHCYECDVCVQGLDHHCGFFNKCIAGCQKWAFYSCLTFGFLAFIDLIMLFGCLII